MEITEAFRRFGVGDKSTALLIVRVGPPSQTERVEEQMRAAVDGVLVPLQSLSNITDWSSIKKVCPSLNSKFSSMRSSY